MARKYKKKYNEDNPRVQFRISKDEMAQLKELARHPTSANLTARAILSDALAKIERCEVKSGDY